jgi:hypothetical protein
VIVGAEAFSSAEISELSRRGHAVGRLSVDVNPELAVDQASVRLKQFPEFTLELGDDYLPTPICCMSVALSQNRYSSYHREVVRVALVIQPTE